MASATAAVFFLAFFIFSSYNNYMTIHHDKLAYGKLAPNMEEISEEEILKMLENLEDEEGEEDKKDSSKNND